MTRPTGSTDGEVKATMSIPGKLAAALMGRVGMLILGALLGGGSGVAGTWLTAGAAAGRASSASAATATADISDLDSRVTRTEKWIAPIMGIERRTGDLERTVANLGAGQSKMLATTEDLRDVVSELASEVRAMRREIRALQPTTERTPR